MPTASSRMMMLSTLLGAVRSVDKITPTAAPIVSVEYGRLRQTQELQEQEYIIKVHIAGVTGKDEDVLMDKNAEVRAIIMRNGFYNLAPSTIPANTDDFSGMETLTTTTSCYAIVGS